MFKFRNKKLFDLRIFDGSFRLQTLRMKYRTVCVVLMSSKLEWFVKLIIKR